MSQVNWAIELKKLESEFDGKPREPARFSQSARDAAERWARQQEEASLAAAGAWLRLVLVASLGVGLYFWPYPRACGGGLFAYMGAQGFVGAGAVWVAAWTWRWRMHKTHAVSILLAVVSLALIATQVLPRIGYARVDARHPPSWSCGVR
jgi:hypothetical protein